MTSQRSCRDSRNVRIMRSAQQFRHRSRRRQSVESAIIKLNNLWLVRGYEVEAKMHCLYQCAVCGIPAPIVSNLHAFALTNGRRTDVRASLRPIEFPVNASCGPFDGESVLPGQATLDMGDWLRDIHSLSSARPAWRNKKLLFHIGRTENAESCIGIRCKG